MPSRLSGGKRAVVAKHKERDAERDRAADGGDWRAEWVSDVNELGSPKDVNDTHRWLGAAAVLVVKATLKDTAVPPEQMRRDAMRQIEQASKVMDPARLSAELDELHRAFEEMKASKDASDDETREISGAPSGVALS